VPCINHRVSVYVKYQIVFYLFEPLQAAELFDPFVPLKTYNLPNSIRFLKRYVTLKSPKILDSSIVQYLKNLKIKGE